MGDAAEKGDAPGLDALAQQWLCSRGTGYKILANIFNASGLWK
jgi:hypothetical protein